MKKLIEKTELSFIVCDNPKCDYEIKQKPDAVELIDYIGLPCPKCGENLLTLKDYLDYFKLMRTVDFINKWFSWVTIFNSKKKLNKRVALFVHVHNGVKIEL